MNARNNVLNKPKSNNDFSLVHQKNNRINLNFLIPQDDNPVIAYTEFSKK